MVTEVSSSRTLSVLRASHDRLTAALAELTEEQIVGPSYDDEWSVAQVASHLGSGAELFGLFLDAGRSGAPAPGQDVMESVWAQWGAKPPADQARDAVDADSAFLDRIAGLSEEEQEQWRLDLFGGEQTLSGFLMMRLSEHAIHTWDITVMGDPSSGVAEDAVALIVDHVDAIAGYTGKPPEQPLAVAVRTTAPERSLVLHLGPDRVRLEPVPGDPHAPGSGADAELALPAEALIRLVYGRLDPDHTPDAVTATGVDLDRLREAFPGV